MNGKLFIKILPEMVSKYGNISLIEAVERWKEERGKK